MKKCSRKGCVLGVEHSLILKTASGELSYAAYSCEGHFKEIELILMDVLKKSEFSSGNFFIDKVDLEYSVSIIPLKK